MGLEDTREDNLDMASREEAVAVVPPGEVEVKKMENYDDFLVHGARKSSFNSGFATDVVAGDIDMAQSQVAVAGSVNSIAEAPVSAGAASSANVDTGPASSSEVVESREKVESKDLNEAVEESAGNNGDSKPNFAEDGTREFIKTQASSDLIADAPTSAASVQDSAEEAAMSVPPADVKEKAVEVSSEDAEVVSEELSAEVARREEVSSKILDEGSAEKRDSEASVVPLEEVKLVAQATTPVNRNEAITTPEAAPLRSVDVQERCAELDFKDAGALNDDVSPQIEDSGSAKNDDSEALTARVEENQEITDAATSANPDDDASSLEASIPPSVGDGEESVELGSKDVGAVSEGVSPSIVDEGSTEKGDSESPSAPLEAVEEVEDASTRTEPDEHLASLNAVPSPSVDAGVKSIDLESNDARASNEDISPLIDEGGSAEIGESEAPEAAVVEVHGLAEATISAALDDDVAGLEAAQSPSTDVGETSVKLDSEDVGAVSDDVRSVVQDEESADKGNNDAPVANISAEPDEAVGNLDAEPPPSVHVGVKSVELDSEGTRALNTDAGPRIEEEVSAEKGDADAAEAPLEEVHDVAAATSSVEADPDAAGLEAASSPPVDVGDKSVELNSGGAGAESEDVSLKSEGEGSAKKGDSTGTEAPAKEVKESAGVAPSVEPEEEAADLDAPPSHSDGLTSVEADAEDAGTSSETVSPKIEDEGSAAEKGESEAAAPAEEVNEVAEPKSIAEPLKAAPSSFANAEEKSLELDPEVARTVSEDVSPEIDDEGSAEKSGSEAPEAPVEEAHEVAEAATSAEPLEAAPSPLVDVEEKPLELGSEVARALSVDASPKTEAEVLAAEKGESEASAPPDEVNEVAEPTSIAEPLEAAPSPSVDVGDKPVELNSEGAGAESEDDSLKSEGEGSAKKGDSTGTEAPAKEVKESAGVAPSVEPEEEAADLDAPPSHSDGLTSVEADAEETGTSSESVSPKIEEEGSAAEKGESEEFPPPEEVNEVAEPVSTAEPLEAAPSPIANVEEKTFELDPEVARAVSEDVSPEVEAEGLAAEKGESEATEAPVEEVHEVAEAATSAEPLEASLSPLVDVEEKPFELSSEVAHALSVDASPKTEAEGSAAEKGESKASAPPEEVNEVAEPTSIAEPLDAASSPPVDFGDKSVELNSESVEAESKNDSLKGEGEGSAKKGDSIGTEAPAKEVNESAGVTPSVELEKDAASLDAPSSHSDGLTSAEADVEGAGKLNENASPKIGDEGSAADKGESEAPVPAEEVNEVAEPKSMAEPLEAVSSPFADVEEKSLEPDPKVARAVREDASPEIEDEGLVAEKGESEALEVPLEQMNEVAEADPDVEPDEAKAILETVPSPSAEVEEKIVGVEDESVDIDNTLVAVELKPADVTDRSGSTEDIAFPKEDLHAEDPANVEESPKTLEQGSAEQGESDVHDAPVEEGHQLAEAAIDAEPDARVASLEATPSPSVHAGGTSAQPDSEDAVAVGDDVSPQFKDGESGENGDSEAPEARVDEAKEVAEATTGAEPAEDASRLDSAISPSLDARERGVELDSEDLRAAASVDVSQNLEAEVLADEGNSAAPEACVEEVRELLDVTTIAWHDEVEESLDAELSASVNAGERELELDSQEAGALNKDTSPTIEDYGSAEKGDSEARETLLEEVHEVAAATSTVGADPDAASMEAAPSPSVDAGEIFGVKDKSDDVEVALVNVEHKPGDVADTCGGIEEKFVAVNAGDVGVVREDLFTELPASEEASPNLLGEGSAEMVGLESPRALVEEVQKVAEAATPVEGNAKETNLDAVLPRSADVEETSVGVDSEDARVVSEDVSPGVEDEGWAEKGDSAALESPTDVDQEVTEATTIPQPDEDEASLEAAPSPSVNVREASVEGDSEDPGALNEVSSPLIEAKELAEKGDTEAAEAPVEEVQEVAGITSTAEPDVDAASVDAALAPVAKLDSEVAGDLIENVSPKTESVGLAEEGDCASPEAPVEEINDVAEATTTVVPDEAVASLEAAPPPSVNVRERNVELNSDDAGTLNVDSSPQIGDGRSVKQGGSAAADAPVEEDGEVAERTTSAEPVEVVTNSEAAPAVDAGERSNELSNEDAGAVNEDVSPNCEDEGSAEKDYSEAPDAPLEKVRESPEATVSAEREAVVATLDTDLSPSVDVGVSSEGARALNEDISPTIEEGGSAEKDDSEAREAPLEEIHVAALASSSVEAVPDSASVEAVPSPSVDPNCEDAGVVREDLIPKVGGEGLAEKVDSAAPEVPAEESHEVAGAAPSAEREEVGASVDAPPSPSVDVEESPVHGIPEGAGDLIEDVNPIIEDGELAELSCSEAPAVPGEEVHNDAESVTSAAPNKDVAILEAALSSSVDIGEEAVELDSEDARAVSADVSPATKYGRSTEGSDNPAPEAPLDVDQEVPVASTSTESDEVGAGLEAETLPFVVSGGEPLDVDSEDAGAVCEDVSPQVGGAVSAGTGEGEAPEAHIEEVQKVADATTTSKPDEDAPSLETANLPSAHLADTSVELNSEDSGAVSDDISPVIKDEGWAEKGGSAATEAPADGKHEVAEAKSIDEPQVDSTGLEDAISPSVVVQERGVELDSENAEAVGAVISPVNEGEGWAEKGNSAAPEAPLEVNQDAATEALSSTEPDEEGASMEAEPSPSDNVEAKPLEEDSAGAGPGADVSLVVEDDGSAAKGDLETAKAPVEAIHPVAEDPSSCALDEDAASLKAATPPSFDVGVRDSELDSDHAGAVIDDVSPAVKDDGWAEKVDIAAPEVPVEADQEVAESSTSAEPDEVVASLEASPSASVRNSEKGIELDSDDVGTVSADDILAAEGEGSTKGGDNAAPEAPVDVNQEVPVAPTSAERDEVVTNLDAESTPSVDDRVNSGEVNSEDARALNEDIGPLIEEGEPGAKGVSEEPEAPVEKVHDGPAATPSAEPEEEAASLNAVASPAVDMEETSFKVNSEEDEILNENVSLKIKDRVATEKCESVAPNAPLGEVQEVAEATIRPQLDEVAASPEPAPSRSVDVGETSVGGLSEDARATIEDVSHVTKDGGSAEKGYSETLDLPVEEVHDVAEATTSTQPDEAVGSLEAGAPSSVEVQERSDRLDSEDAGAVNENFRPEREAEGSNDESDSESPSVPLEVVEEVEDASTRTEPGQHLANENAVPSPSVDVGVKSNKLDSEGTQAFNEDVGPRIEEEVSAEKGDADAAEVPLKEVHDVAAATSSVEADPDAASLEAAPSPPVDVGDKSVELNSGGAGAESEDANLSEAEGSAKAGGSTGFEAPEKEIKEFAGVAPSVEPEEEAADLDAPPSHSDGLTSVEADAEETGTSSESVSPKIEDEGSAAEKGESEAPVPAEEVNEVAEPKSTAEPLEAAPSTLANVEEKSFEPDPEVARAVSEDVSPEIEDEGLAEKGGSEAAQAPVEEVHEVAEAATSAEPLESSPSPLVDVEEKPFELSSEIARALNVDASPDTKAEGSAAEKGEREASVPPEEVNEVAEPSIAEPLEAAPSPFANVGEKSLEVDPEVAPSVSGDVSSETEDEGSAEKGDSAVPEDEVPEVTEAKTNAEPDEDVATLEAAPSHAADVGEEPLELGSEVARPLSVDNSPKIEAEGSAAENGDSKASAAPEKTNEDTEPSSVAEPLETAPSPVADVGEESVELDSEDAVASGEEVSPELEVVGSAEEGDSDSPDAPVEEANEVADAAAHVEPEETVASHEGVPSSSTEFGEQAVDVDDKSVDLADETVGIKDKSVEVSSGDVGAVSEELPAEAAASDEVSRTIADEQSAETGGSEAAESPVEEVHEVAEAATSAEPDEDVAILEAAPSSFVDAEEKPLELDSEVARALSVDASPETEAEGSAAEKGDSTVPEEEVHELNEATTNAEPDEDVATLEAAPSPAVSVEEKPLELGSEVARALSVDATSDTEAEESAAEKGGSEAPEAPVEEVNEVAEPITVAQPLGAAPSPFVDVEDRSLELDPEVAGAVSEDVSPETEDEGSAEKGDSTVPEDEVHELTEATTNAEPEEDVASLEAAPSHVANVEEKSVKLDPGVAPAVRQDVSPENEGEGSAKKGDNEASEAPAEEVREVAETATSAEPDEDVATLEAAPLPFVDVKEEPLELGSEVGRALRVDASPDIEDKGSAAKKGESGASDPAEEVIEVAEPISIAEPLEAAPSPFANVGEKSLEVDPEVAPSVSGDVSSETEDEGSAEKGDSAVPEDEVPEVTEAKTNAEPDEDVATLEAAPSHAADVGEEPLELGSEVARPLSVDNSPKIEAEGSAAENSESEASAAPEKINENTEPSSVAEPLETAPSPFANVEEKSFELDPEVARPLSEDASPKNEDARSAEEGDSDAPEAPVEEANEVADAAAHVEPEETVASHEGVPSSSTEFGEQGVDINNKSVELGDKAVGNEDKSVEVSSGDVGAVSEELPAQIAASDEVRPTIPDEESAETGKSEAADSPVIEAHEDAEAPTSAQPNEDVATLEATPSSFVDAEEKPLELDSEVALALSVDASPDTEAEASSAEKGDTAVPEEVVHELKEATTNAEPDEDVATLEAAPSPAVSVEEKPLELSSEVSRALSVDAGPKVEAEGSKDDSKAPEAPVEEINEVSEPITVAKPLEAAPSPFANMGEKSLELDPEVAPGVCEDVSPEIEGEGSAEKGDSAVPEDEIHEITEAATDVEHDEDVATLEAAPSRVADVEEKSFELNPRVAGAVSEDASPKIEYEGSVKKGDNEAPEAPVEEVREVADAATSAEPNEDVATLEAASSPFVDVKAEPLELGSEVARALSVDASPKTEAEASSAETGDSAVPEEVVHELKEATANAEPDEDVATLEAAPSPTVNVEEKPLELGSEIARALNVDATPNTEAEGSAAEKGESEAPEAPLEEVNVVAEPTPAAEPVEAAPSPFVNVEKKSFELDPEVAGAVSEDVSSESEDDGSAEKGDSAVPEEEVHELTEAKTNAELDEDVASLETAPSPVADVGEESVELDSEDAVASGEEVSPELEVVGSAEEGDSDSPDAPVEEANEVADAAAHVEPEETVASHEGVPSSSTEFGEQAVDVDDKSVDLADETVGIKDKSVEVSSGDVGAVSEELPAEAAASDEVSRTIADEQSAETGGSEAAESPVEEVHEVAEAATSAEPDEDVAILEAAPSSFVDAEEKPLELDSEVARALSVDASPETEAEGSAAEKGDSTVPEEEVHELNEATTNAEPDEDVATLEAAPSPAVSVEEKPLELGSEVARALSVDATSDTEAEESAAEKGGSEAPEAPVEEVNEVAEPITVAQPLGAAPSPFVDVEDRSLELDPEVAGAVSEDVSPETEDEGSAEKGDSTVPEDEVHELTEATTNAEPEEDVASLEAAPSSVAHVGEESVKLDPENAVASGEEVSPEFEDVGWADKGDSDSPDAPVEEANEVADTAAHVEPEETVASHEGVPSSSTEFGEQVVDVDDNSFDLADKAFRIKDKSVEVCSGDVGAVGEELPAEVGASEEVSPTIPVEESAETGVSEAPEAPAEEVREVAEAPTSAQPDEDVAILEAAPSPFVDAEEIPLELGSEVARALSVDASPGTEEEGSAMKGESETPDTPLEEVHEATEARSSAEADEEGAGVKAELSPIADVEEKPDDVEDKLVDVEDKPAEVQDKSVDVEDRAVEINSEDAGAVSEELPAEVATSEEVSPKTPDEASDEESAKTGDSEAPEATAEEVREVAEAGISAKPDDDVATLEAAPSSFVDAEEIPLELGSEIARALSVDASPVTDAEGSAAEKGDSAVPEEEVHELTEASTNAEPDEDVATLEAAPSAAVSVEERPLEMGSEVARDLSVDVSSKFEDEGLAGEIGESKEIASLEEVNEVAEPIASAEPVEAAPSPFADVEEKYFERDLEVGRPLSEGVSPKIADEGLAAEKGDNDTPEAPVEEVNEVAQAATEIEPDEARASLETVPSPSAEVEDKFADVDEISVDTDNKAVAVEPKPADVADRSGDTEDVTFSKEDLHAEDPANVEESPKTLDEGSAEQGESEVHDAPLEEGHEVAEAPIDAEPDARVASLEAMLSPSVHAGGTSAQPESEDAVAVGDDVSPHFEDGESGENGVSEAPEASVEEVREIPDVPTSAEHDEVEASLDAGRSPSVNAGEWDSELDSEEAGALNEDISPTIEDCGSVERGDSEARETPLEEVHEVAAATSTVGADPDAASMEAAPSPPVDVGDKSVELNSGGAGAESEDVSLKGEAEGSAKKVDSTGIEAPTKEVNESAGVAPSVEPEEEAADLDAPPSHSDGLTSVEADAEETGTSSESVSPKIEDERSAAEKGESKEIAPPEEVNEVAEPKSIAEPLEAAPSPIANVEEKTFELDPEVARAVSEDVIPEIKDEGLGAEKGESEAPAPVEQMNEVAEAATDVEPNKAIGSLETMPSPSAEVEEKNLDVDDESVDIDNKPAAVEPKPADVTDRSGSIGDIAFAREDLHAEDPAIAEESPKILDQGSAEQGESDVHDAPVEEDHEVAEAATNAEPDARVASLEATPSPSAHAGGTSAQPDSEDAVAVGDDVSPQFGDGESGEKGESEAPEARVEEVQEVAEATTGAEPAEDASRLDSAISPSLDARERGVELDSEDLRAAASVDVSRNLEDEVLADEGNSAAPEACVEEVRELLDVTTIAWHDEVEESLDAELSASVNAGERELELDSQEAGAVSDAVRPVIKDEELARKGDSAVPEAPVEVDQDVAKSSTSAEPDEVGASLDAKLLPCIDEGVTSIEPDSEESRALNESSSPLIEAGGSVEEGNPEAAEAPLEQIREVAKASSNAEPDIINGASLEAAISPSFGAIERGIELDSEDTGVASEDASSQCKDGGSAKQGDSTEAAGAHGEEVQEISVATTRAEPGGDAASEPAIAPNVDTGVEGTTGNGEGDTPDVPAGGVGEVAEAAIHVDPGERAAALEAVPSPSAEVEEKYVHAEENSVDAESKPIDIDYKPRDALLHNSVGNDDKIVEMKSGDVGVVRDESPAEVPAIEDVSPPFPNDGLTEKGYGGAPPAPVEVANEVVGATTPVERNEAVASREAAAPYAVDVWERYFEQDSTEAGALNEDLGSQIEDGGMAKKGDSVAAAEAPLEKLHEVADVPTSAKADEFATSVEAAPSPSLDIGEKFVGSEVADDVGKNVSPVTRDEGTAENVEPGDVADKSNEIAEVNSAILQAAPPHSVDERGRSVVLDSKDAGVLNEDVNRQAESSVSAKKRDNEGTAREAPAEEVSEVITTSESEPDDAVANLKAVDVREKSSEVRSEDAKAVSKDASRRPRKFRWMWWGLGTVVLSVFAASLFAFFSGQSGGLAVPFQVLPFLP